ncbi:CDP-alcohol phosphatidyltransferase family protein [Nocardiopsis ansamitocini]|uniref:CDP-diacylglycerol--glycerol-3-phosphate 3-phosphatidyltransferase n=1 Tax=Nocardiopsis ansamitocini TaxID=1670832 RepID=A0A9W6UHB4_9ACTN|nr:CDP-alcohol phosphatidyltransferase family protein [Nocardiopsis ansamitocini]GLU45800.1 CDP-diacylglycerol--glycerol-3-phosphate 3-phosphatidyltransferase [Nocardiopsis ansamitocini]
MAISTSAGSGADRIWTVPNLISIVRLLGVPLFLWLVLGPQEDWWALLLLAMAGVSDWLDGKIARAWNQTSRLGTVLDPMADRLYIFAALLGLVVRDIVPWWLMAILVLRDLLIIVALPILRHYGYGPLPVNFAGKAATLCLLYSFPLLFVAAYDGIVGDVAQIVGWAFAIWGTAIYWWAGLLYTVQGLRLMRQSRGLDRPTGSEQGPGAPEVDSADDPDVIERGAQA